MVRSVCIFIFVFSLVPAVTGLMAMDASGNLLDNRVHALGDTYHAHSGTSLYADLPDANSGMVEAMNVVTGASVLPAAAEQRLTQSAGDEGTFKIARIQYRGGGDWYSSPTALTNMIEYASRHLPIHISSEYDDVQIGSRDLHNYPFVYMSGHGNIEMNQAEMENLRNYLENGGFLYVDDDYGFDQYVRPILQDIFPDEDFIELPPEHPIYRNVFDFPDGRPPKVHEHDGQPPQAFGVYRDGRMVLLYTYESNPGDGWAYDQHDNPEEIVQAALRFGVNLLVYVFTSGR